MSEQVCRCGHTLAWHKWEPPVWVCLGDAFSCPCVGFVPVLTERQQRIAAYYAAQPAVYTPSKARGLW